jgi:hypothetical protein
MFIWEKEIKEVIGNKVIFKDGSETEEYNEKQLWYLITKEPKDETELRNIVLENVARDVLDVIQEHNIKKWELSPLIQCIVDSFNQSFFIAVGKAFGTYQEWINPVFYQENIRMNDIIQMKDK